VAINVVSLTAIDTLLKSKWEGMKDALGQGNIEQAMSFFAQSSQERYRGIFNVVRSQLSEIVAGMSAIQLIHIDNGVAKYRIRRQEAAGLITYYIYFVVDGDAIWRIKQF
jgi:RNase P/RNase MRP subunit POP5